MTLMILRYFLIDKKRKDRLNQLKQGDYVVTMTGLTGTVVGIKKPDETVFVMLLTGDTTHKSYITVDIDSIYDIVQNPGTILDDSMKVE